MVQWVRALAVLAKDPGSIPSTHMEVHYLLSTSTLVMYRCTNRQNTHTHKTIKINLKVFFFLIKRRKES